MFYDINSINAFVGSSNSGKTYALIKILHLAFDNKTMKPDNGIIITASKYSLRVRWLMGSATWPDTPGGSRLPTMKLKKVVMPTVAPAWARMIITGQGNGDGASTMPGSASSSVPFMNCLLEKAGGGKTEAAY